MVFRSGIRDALLDSHVEDDVVIYSELGDRRNSRNNVVKTFTYLRKTQLARLIRSGREKKFINSYILFSVVDQVVSSDCSL